MTAAADNLLFFNSLETSPQKRGWTVVTVDRVDLRSDRHALGNGDGCGSFASAVQRGPGGAVSGMARTT